MLLLVADGGAPAERLGARLELDEETDALDHAGSVTAGATQHIGVGPQTWPLELGPLGTQRRSGRRQGDAEL